MSAHSFARQGQVRGSRLVRDQRLAGDTVIGAGVGIVAVGVLEIGPWGWTGVAVVGGIGALLLATGSVYRWWVHRVAPAEILEQEVEDFLR